jgi:Primase C terminal 1 (PriCT-1)/Bifunctional DNA primase/polymerase, N-terminal
MGECFDMTPYELRLALKAGGFSPIPIKGKRPLLAEWQTMISVTEKAIARWPGGNTGILTKWAPAGDLDITNQDAADAVELLAKKLFDDRGIIPVRFGNAPKRALMFQTQRPFAKCAVHFVDPGGHHHKIELLGNGQQLVVHGRHPDTRRDYSWHGPCPWTIRRIDLAEITEREAHGFLAAAADLLEEQFGFERTQVCGAVAPTTVATSRRLTPRGRGYWTSILQTGADDGFRNQTCAALAGRLAWEGKSLNEALGDLLAWNANNRPPLPHRVIERTLKSIWKRDSHRHDHQARTRHR